MAKRPTSPELPALAELRARAQWVVWRFEARDGKRTKVPYAAPTRRADAADPATWLSYSDAHALAAKNGHFDGTGFVVRADDPYTGIDKDRCRDPKTGTLTAEAQALVARVNSYTEVTPSGTGLRIWIRAKKPGPHCRKGTLEVYDTARFFTVTGQHVAGTPTTIEPRQGALDALYAEVFRPTTPVEDSPAILPPRTDDHAVLTKALATGGERFYRLYFEGDTSAYDEDASRADFALLTGLALYSGDPAQVERLARRSALERAKWDARRRDTTWLGAQIADALTATAEKRAASGTSAPRYQLLSDEELLQLPDPEWLLRGWLPAGSLLELFGQSGIGKSFLALDWALHVAAGMPWMKCAVRPGPVIYVMGEGGKGVKQRVAAWRKAHRITAWLPIRFLRGPVKLLDPKAVTAFLDAVRSAGLPERPALILFDTRTHMTAGASESGAEDLSQVVEVVSRIQRDTGAAVLFLHHPPLSNPSRGRGSDIVSNAADAYFSLTKDAETGTLTLKNTKQRDTETAAPLYLALTKVDGASSLVVERSARPEADAPLPVLIEKVLAEVPEGEWFVGFRQLRSAIGTLTNGTTPRTDRLEKALAELRRAKRILSDTNGPRGATRYRLPGPEAEL